MTAQDTAAVERRSHDDRRREIVQAVRDLAAETDIGRLSVASITARVGCTRSLFYHYFSTKEDALNAVLDLSIDEFIDKLRAWNGMRVAGDIEGALDDFAALLKQLITVDYNLPCAVVGGNVALYSSFIDRVADRMATYICSSTVVDFSRAHTPRIDHVYETFYMLISGLIMYIRTHPDCNVDVLKDIVASTLHLEGYTEKHKDRRPAD